MRNVFFAALLYVLSLSGQVRAENIVFSDSDLRNEAENLLVERLTEVSCALRVPVFTDG